MTELLPHREVTTGIPGDGCAICKTPPRHNGFMFRGMFPEPIHNPQKKEPHMYQQVFGVQACEHCGHGQHHPIHQDFRAKPSTIVYSKASPPMTITEYEKMVLDEQKEKRDSIALLKGSKRRTYNRGDLVFWTIVPGFLGGTLVTCIVGSVLGW